MKKVHFREWRVASPTYWGILAILAGVIAVAGFAVLYMEHNGHWVTGMTNQVVWGLPHVFAIFLIVAASGALNVASIGSVFDKKVYKPLGRFSGLVAIALLAGVASPHLAINALPAARAHQVLEEKQRLADAAREVVCSRTGGV